MASGGGLAAGLVLALLVANISTVSAAGNPMKLVGTLSPWKDGQYSNIAADAGRHLAYLGSYDDQGVAVIDTTDPSQPVLTDVLSTHITSYTLTSDSADLDLVGRYLAVSHQAWSDAGAFAGISIYDTQPDPYHPVLLRHIAIPGPFGIHTVQLDPEVESGRPYAYANGFEGNTKVVIVNILTGDILSYYTSPELAGCQPSEAACQAFNAAHEGFVQRHPQSGRVLDYVAYWDSGLRIVDVTDPAQPVEVGSLDYGPGTNNYSAHYAAATPSGNWAYLEDEVGVGGSGGVHVLDTHTCDGTSYCTPDGGWLLAYQRPPGPGSCVSGPL